MSDNWNDIERLELDAPVKKRRGDPPARTDGDAANDAPLAMGGSSSPKQGK